MSQWHSEIHGSSTTYYRDGAPALTIPGEIGQPDQFESQVLEKAYQAGWMAHCRQQNHEALSAWIKLGHALNATPEQARSGLKQPQGETPC